MVWGGGLEGFVCLATRLLNPPPLPPVQQTDYGVIVFADRRFARPDKRNKLPGWVQDALEPGMTALAVDTAASQVDEFLRAMSVPWTAEERAGTLWGQEHFDEADAVLAAAGAGGDASAAAGADASAAGPGAKALEH